MLKYSAIALVIGFILDLIIGDPRCFYHPVRLIGKAIEVMEKFLRKVFPKTPGGERVAGLALIICICAASGLVPWLILKLCFQVHTALAVGVMAIICYQFVAVKSLKVESMKVYYSLKNGTIEDGRDAVSMIVGRDTQGLDERGITKAAVETIAENFSDGVFAPLFYFVIGGPVLMLVYKGINTMDSMVGYKNDKYINFGRYAAKLDDVANYIPSRLAGLILVLAAGVCGESMKGAWRIFKRDRYNHASPNSAQTEAAVAGALQIQLAGNAYYFGKLYEKPTIGDAIRPVEVEDIRRANRLMLCGGGITVVILAALHTLTVLILLGII